MEKLFNTEETVTTPSEPCEDWQRARGKELIRVLGLKPVRPVRPECGGVWPESRYDLGEFGTKTALGVYRSIKRVLEGVE